MKGPYEFNEPIRGGRVTLDAERYRLLLQIAKEADRAKQLLRRAGHGVTGMGLYDTVRDLLQSIELDLDRCNLRLHGQDLEEKDGGEKGA